MIRRNARTDVRYENGWQSNPPIFASQATQMGNQTLLAVRFWRIFIFDWDLIWSWRQCHSWKCAGSWSFIECGCSIVCQNSRQRQSRFTLQQLLYFAGFDDIPQKLYHGLGTLRANRVPNIKLSSDAELAKKNVESGYSALGIDISSVL